MLHLTTRPTEYLYHNDADGDAVAESIITHVLGDGLRDGLEAARVWRLDGEGAPVPGDGRWLPLARLLVDPLLTGVRVAGGVDLSFGSGRGAASYNGEWAPLYLNVPVIGKRGAPLKGKTQAVRADQTTAGIRDVIAALGVCAGALSSVRYGLVRAMLPLYGGCYECKGTRTCTYSSHDDYQRWACRVGEGRVCRCTVPAHLAAVEAVDAVITASDLGLALARLKGWVELADALQAAHVKASTPRVGDLVEVCKGKKVGVTGTIKRLGDGEWGAYAVLQLEGGGSEVANVDALEVRGRTFAGVLDEGGLCAAVRTLPGVEWAGKTSRGAGPWRVRISGGWFTPLEAATRFGVDLAPFTVED